MDELAMEELLDSEPLTHEDIRTLRTLGYMISQEMELELMTV